MKKSINIVNKIDQLAFEGKIDNQDMVQIIELLGSYLNLMTISEYAKHHNKSYNGVKKHRNIITIFGNKYVLENN